MSNWIWFWLLLGLLSFSACQSCEEKEEEPEAGISEQFFLQRAYPEPRFPLQGYMQAMEMSRRHSALRSALPAGFEENWDPISASNFSGRVNALAVHPEDESVMYAGLASGGIFKTIDGGRNWRPVFDQQAYLAIGALALDPSDPEVVYAGTGDPNITGYPFIGDGLYRSTNGGEDWEYLGLREARIISKVIVDPKNPLNIWVATMGLPFERTPDRGVYKSSDGGKSWKKVLFVSDQTGITDMVMDPFNPKQLFAASWDRIRNNRESVIAGPNARIFRSQDGGETWTTLSAGLPNESVMGRIALAISGVTPGRIFARYVGANQELLNIFRTDNAGETWSPAINWANSNLAASAFMGGTGFGWYFGTMAVHPDNDLEIYVLGVDLWRTRDGGRIWEMAAPGWRDFIVHADKHDLVFTKSRRKILATDGGIYAQAANESSWTWAGTIPNLQFYRVAYNPHQPDWFYGGSQDNGTLGGPRGGNWERIYPFDGFATLFHPTEPNLSYIQIQNGRKFVSWDGGRNFSNASNGFPSNERVNWDCPFIMGQHQRYVLYSATFRVYKSTAGPVPQWIPVSPDLTDGNRFGNPFHNISTLAESPLDSNLLYAGTSDGNVWRSNSSQGDWVPVQNGLPDRYVTSVKASPHFRDYVYATFSGYKDNEFLPHIFRSKNQGATWEDIGRGLPPVAVNNVLIVQGHADSVLIIATDAGVYATVNAGGSWHRLGKNMPAIAIYDLAINEKKNLLIAGSYGRSLFAYSLNTLLMGPAVGTRNLQPAASVEFELFPQPAHTELQIRYGTLPAPANALQVYDTSGKLLKELRLTSRSAQGQETLGIGVLPPGMYVAVLRWPGGGVGKQFVKW